MASTFEIIEAIGRDNVVALQKALGPAAVYIPTSAAPDHGITQIIGLDAMEALCRELGGTTVWIGSGYANQERNQEIIRLRTAGIPIHYIGRRFGLTARCVRKITQGERRRAISVRQSRHAKILAQRYRMELDGRTDQTNRGDRGPANRT